MIMVVMILAFLRSWPPARLQRGSGQFDEDSVGPRAHRQPGWWGGNQLHRQHMQLL